MASNARTEIKTSYGTFTVAGAISLRSRLRGMGAYYKVIINNVQKVWNKNVQML